MLENWRDGTCQFISTNECRSRTFVPTSISTDTTECAATTYTSISLEGGSILLPDDSYLAKL